MERLARPAVSACDNIAARYQALRLGLWIINHHPYRVLACQFKQRRGGGHLRAFTRIELRHVTVLLSTQHHSRLRFAAAFYLANDGFGHKRQRQALTSGTAQCGIAQLTYGQILLLCRRPFGDPQLRQRLTGFHPLLRGANEQFLDDAVGRRRNNLQATLIGGDRRKRGKRLYQRAFFHTADSHAETLLLLRANANATVIRRFIGITRHQLHIHKR